MRKLIAVLAGFAMVWMVGCGEGVPAPVSSTEPTTLDPNRSMAIMEPLQGGKMLYIFKGSEPYGMEYDDYSDVYYPVYPIGLIDQDGKLVTAPKYHIVEFFYDEDLQLIIGFVALQNQEITIYQLDGESRVLPCEGYRVRVCPGGRYAIIEAAKPTKLGDRWTGDPKKDGLFDLQGNKYIVEPKIGQAIFYEGRGVAVVKQFDSENMEGNVIAERAINCADGSTYKEDGQSFPQLWPPHLLPDYLRPSQPIENQRELPNLEQYRPEPQKGHEDGWTFCVRC